MSAPHPLLPPRLRRLAALAPELGAAALGACAPTVTDGVTVPRHVSTGALRRGWMLGCGAAGLVADDESLQAARSALWAALRAAGVPDSAVAGAMAAHVAPRAVLAALVAGGAVAPGRVQGPPWTPLAWAGRPEALGRWGNGAACGADAPQRQPGAATATCSGAGA